jgi:hypothetical protein
MYARTSLVILAALSLVGCGAEVKRMAMGVRPGAPLNSAASDPDLDLTRQIAGDPAWLISEGGWC